MIYVVQAYKWGGLDGHSYVVGVFPHLLDAIDAANKEEDYRGGKYECIIYETEILTEWQEDIPWHEVEID